MTHERRQQRQLSLLGDVLVTSTIGPDDEPPYGWQHLPIKASEPWKLPVNAYWSEARVEWHPQHAYIIEVLRDTALPFHEVGLRVGFEAAAERLGAVLIRASASR